MKKYAFILLLYSCSQDSAEIHRIQFQEVDSIISSIVCGQETQTSILEVNGCGIALVDYDNDGDADLFVVSQDQQGQCKLYANQSTSSSITFSDVTSSAGIQFAGLPMGVAVGDVNGDTFDDLYITCFGPNKLLMNQGNGTFQEQASYANVDDEGWGTSASFGDLDGDGDLDLYVCNYLEFDIKNPPKQVTYKGVNVIGGPHGLPPQHDIVYENLGDGTFAKANQKWKFTSPAAFGLNVAILDFNNDGKQDVYVGNDSMANSLYLNQDDGFKDVGFHSGTATNGEGSMQATMGIAIGDVNGDSLPDILTTNFSSDTNTLHVNSGIGFFDDRTNQFGLGLMSRMLLGWTCAFQDFDSDGFDDLVILNGHVYPNATIETMDSSRFQPLTLMSWTDNRFVQTHGISGEFDDRAGLFSDLDGDGDVDMIIAPRYGAIRVYKNVGAASSDLEVTLQGSGQNSKGLGAKVTVQLNDGSFKTKWNHDGSGFQSSMSVPLLFAFPDNAIPQSIEIVWADGLVQVVDVVGHQMHITQE